MIALEIVGAVFAFLFGFSLLFWIPAIFIEPEWAGNPLTFWMRAYGDLLHDAFGPSR